MRLAIIGSRKAPKNIAVDILPYVPADATEIVSGGAEGVDKAAEDIAAALSLLHGVLPHDLNLQTLQKELRKNCGFPLHREDCGIPYENRIENTTGGKSS